MAGIGPDDLYELAEELRDICTEALDSIPTFTGLEELFGAPDRIFVSPGAPVPDCREFLAVHVNGIRDRLARTQDGGAPKLNVPNLIVTLLRCVSQGTGEGNSWEPPTVEALNAEGRQHAADGWALWNRIYNLLQGGLFRDRCSHVEFVLCQSLATEGGSAGWQLGLNLALEGYQEDLST